MDLSDRSAEFRRPHYTRRQRWTFLAILFLVGTSASVDKILISVLLEPIKQEFNLSDTQLGLLGGLSFAILYSVLGIPIARLADQGNRRLLIAGAVSIWSVMTALCGAATNFATLLLCRVGVSIGEAGATPPSQSLIADYFSPGQRGRAIGVFTTSGTVGYLFGVSLGSQLVSTHGWRTTFVIFGLPGIAIALLVLLVLREPRTHRPSHLAGSQSRESFRASASILLSKRSYVRLLIAHTIYAFAVYGALLFVPSYMTRVLGYPIADAGYYFGITSAIAVFLGSISGGVVVDKLARRDLRWTIWSPAILFIIAGAPLSAMFFMRDLAGFLVMNMLGMLCLNAALPAAFAAVHLVCGDTRRATAIAVVLFLVNLLGFGLGPLVTGILSDTFTARHGAVGLRYALLMVMLLIPVTGFILLTAARTLRQDQED